nr:MAG TPA: hypothetical protein [Caudoviricetes sp.]
MQRSLHKKRLPLALGIVKRQQPNGGKLVTRH